LTQIRAFLHDFSYLNKELSLNFKELSYKNKEPSYRGTNAFYLGSETTLKKPEMVIIKYGVKYFFK
jgi:hypothetical protein